MFFFFHASFAGSVRRERERERERERDDARVLSKPRVGLLNEN